MEFKILVILHILGAAIWIGGALILSLAVLPKARKENDNVFLIKFFQAFYKIGIVALIVQFLTGFRMAMTFLPIGEWFAFEHSASTLIVMKLTLILLSIVLVVRARYFCLPEEGGSLSFISVNIYITTALGILLAITGLSFRISIF